MTFPGSGVQHFRFTPCPTPGKSCRQGRSCPWWDQSLPAKSQLPAPKELAQGISEEKEILNLAALRFKHFFLPQKRRGKLRTKAQKGRVCPHRQAGQDTELLQPHTLVLLQLHHCPEGLPWHQGQWGHIPCASQVPGGPREFLQGPALQ